MTDRIWHCPNGTQIEMTPEEVETMDWLNKVMDEYPWPNDEENN